MTMKSKLFITTVSSVTIFLGVCTPILLLATAKSSVSQTSTHSDRTELETFTLPGEFIVQYPRGWFVNHTSNSGAYPRELVMISNEQLSGTEEVLTTMIKTDLQIVPGSLEIVSNEMIEGIAVNEGTIARRGNAFVGGRDAVRLWASDSESDFIVTLIRYNDTETVQVVTFYNQQTARFLPLIQQIHGSFRSLQE